MLFKAAGYKKKVINIKQLKKIVPVILIFLIWSNGLIRLSKYKITKTRYQLEINKKNWVVDVFEESNSCLKIAEIELNSESEEIQVPSWCGKEITGIKSLSNASLAKAPISELSVKDRIKIKSF